MAYIVAVEMVAWLVVSKAVGLVARLVVLKAYTMVVEWECSTGKDAVGN